LSEIILDRWLWITIISIFLIIVLPFVVIWFILTIADPNLRLVATILLVVLWGVVSGYKEWVTSKRGKEEPSRGS
jgi:hypothetical protein